jgi:transcriptional regulator with XRE-family HTH domain
MKTETRKLLAQKLKEKRTNLNLSLRDVQTETGLNFSTLNRIERCEANPDADTILIIAEWLRIPVEILMDEVNHDLQPIVNSLDRPMPEIIRDLLKNDPQLTPGKQTGFR